MISKSIILLIIAGASIGFGLICAGIWLIDTMRKHRYTKN